MRLGDVEIDLQGVLKSEYLHPDTVLLKEPGVYCFLLRCNKVEAKPFMDWVVETVFPREVRKLSQKLEEHHCRTTQLQQAVEDHDNRIQTIQHENVGLQGEIRNARRTITDLIENHHVSRSGAIDTVLVVVEKNADEDTKEHKKAKNFDKYMLRCQKKQVDGRLSVLRAKYPNMVVLEPRCDDGNAIHVWNRFKQRVLTKKNYFRNHFRLPPDAEELFKDMFGILV